MESRKGGLRRSLRLRLSLFLALVGVAFAAFSSYNSYYKAMDNLSGYVDEELSQIANVIINYDMPLPRRWQQPYGRIIVGEDGVVRKRSLGIIPSLNDLFDYHQEIIIAPLFTQPGEIFYLPMGIKDGFYSVLIKDNRVRVYVATNHEKIRFIVARPLSPVSEFVSRILYTSLAEFLILIALYIPTVFFLVHVMFKGVRKLALEIQSRRENDLREITAKKVPSELDAFICALNLLFKKTSNSLENERRFIANAAHEMRTPLTALGLQAENIDEKSLPKEIKDKFLELKKAIFRQQKLTNDLLTFARSQSVRELNLREIKIKELFAEVIDNLGSIADKKNIDFGLEGECDKTLKTDPDLLRTIVSNLAANALNYTPPGGRVDLSCKIEGDRLYIHVDDTGPGIGKAELDKVLEPFYRVGGDTSNTPGTGLGLAIVTSCCKQLGAKLRLENRKGGGLRASVSFLR